MSKSKRGGGSIISSPVRRRIVILAVSSLVSCIFFSSPMLRIPTPGYFKTPPTVHLPEYEPPDRTLETATVTVTAYIPTKTGASDVKDVLRSEGTTESFRERLRPEVLYITSWPSSDWNNQVVALTNLIYLALLTERVATIPPFAPFAYMSQGLEFGEVFDITRLQQGIGKPVLEWHQVKSHQSETVDELGCWSTRRDAFNATLSNPTLISPEYLNLDISYTRTPDWTLLRPAESHVSFWALVALAFPDSETVEHEGAERVALEPDRHLLCFDDLSLASARNVREYTQEMSPAWRFVGRHMHWSARLQYIADLYTRKACGVVSEDSIPPYIAIYAQYRDPSSWCDLPAEECFPPLFMYARRVQELKAEIRATTGIEVERVIVTSDDNMEGIWWEAVRKRGWSRLDHSRTVERYGPWYPLLIDAVVRSGALGFVTADDSLTSVLATRRVSSWQGGIAKRVLWETKLRQELRPGMKP